MRPLPEMRKSGWAEVPDADDIEVISMLASEAGMKACTETGTVQSNSAAALDSVMGSLSAAFVGHSGPKARHRIMPPRMTARTFFI